MTSNLNDLYILKNYRKGSASGPSLGLDFGLLARGHPERLEKNNIDQNVDHVKKSHQLATLHFN